MHHVVEQLNHLFEEALVSKCIIVMTDPAQQAPQLFPLLRQHDFCVDEPYLCAAKNERVMVRFLQHRTRMLATSLDMYRRCMERLVSKHVNLVVHVSS